ncbi:MAG: hypothetical protein O2923_09790 [Verrucomicrobia bacterium]|nr:hypothetical protein [Verrucomicrobiota bacterium]MDA1088229.1 hypothetical protein [Verrucomicrobiota bacterium]
MTTLSLYPLDSRCCLLSNIVWEPDENGTPCLHRQKLWVRFPAALKSTGLTAHFGGPVGRVRVEVAEDAGGRAWRLLAEAELTGSSPTTLTWLPVTSDNVRVHVVEPAVPCFPLGGYFSRLELHTDGAALEALPAVAPLAAAVPLVDRSPCLVEPFAGHAGVQSNEALGLCHDRPRTDRLQVSANGSAVEFASSVFRMGFDRQFARITHLGWDTYDRDRARGNLLSTAHTQGAFPVVLRDCRRLSSESCGGAVEVAGRRVTYSAIRPVPEIEWNYAFSLRENGFTLDVDWRCTQTFQAAEIAALRIPFDLYRSVVNVLAMPDTAGPSGLVTFPLIINAPNHGVLQVTVKESPSSAPVCARILPFRTRAELWLDLIPGAHPLPSGLFEMPAGEGRVTLDFEVTRIFPFANQDFFGWWNLPPFYSFADRENITGALCNAWLTGLAFRPDLGRFANNSVSESAACCAHYYADIAAYTPLLAPGLDARQFIRFAAEQLLRDAGGASDYSNSRHFPTAATSPVDCAWLYVAAAGDWDWMRQWRGGLQAFTDNLLGLEAGQTGLVAGDFSGRPGDASESELKCSTWCDSIRTGHFDSYNNAHAFRALRRAAELLERLEDAPRAAAARAMAERLKSSFLSTFLDAHSQQIMMWVDTDGRSYGLRSHMHLGAAVTLGLVPDEQARALLTEYLQRLCASGHTHYEWGLPIFLDPVPAHLHNAWKGKGVEPDGTDQAGVYQNGAIHTHQTYYILQALYRVGMRREANDLFMKMTPLVLSGELCGGLHSGLDWRHPVDGRASGYEGLLAEQFHFLLAAVTGYLGCELTVDGLVINGPETERIRNLKPNFARLAGPHPASGNDAT